MPMIISAIYLFVLVFAIVILHAALCAFASLRLCVKFFLFLFSPTTGCVAPLDAGSPAASSSIPGSDCSLTQTSLQRYTPGRAAGPARPANYQLIRRQILTALIPKMPAIRHPR